MDADAQDRGSRNPARLRGRQPRFGRIAVTGRAGDSALPHWDSFSQSRARRGLSAIICSQRRMPSGPRARPAHGRDDRTEEEDASLTEDKGFAGKSLPVFSQLRNFQCHELQGEGAQFQSRTRPASLAPPLWPAVVQKTKNDLCFQFQSKTCFWRKVLQMQRQKKKFFQAPIANSTP